jgi:hypothetical protein
MGWMRKLENYLIELLNGLQTIAELLRSIDAHLSHIEYLLQRKR